jgi:hypothetical protein
MRGIGAFKAVSEDMKKSLILAIIGLVLLIATFGARDRSRDRERE